VSHRPRVQATRITQLIDGLLRIEYLDRSLARFSPKILYWGFITVDIASLALQAGGGATSSVSTGSNAAGLRASLAGLSIQVITLVLFSALAVDYVVRYYRQPTARPPTTTRFRLYLGFMAASVIFILGRCAYRIDELREGYGSEMFQNEKLFIAFESA
jgi:hypothetical protein